MDQSPGYLVIKEAKTPRVVIEIKAERALDSVCGLSRDMAILSETRREKPSILLRDFTWRKCRDC